MKSALLKAAELRVVLLQRAAEVAVAVAVAVAAAAAVVVVVGIAAVAVGGGVVIVAAACKVPPRLLHCLDCFAATCGMWLQCTSLGFEIGGI